ncbi:MAG: Exodeoxyribonuclease 7 large subunit [Opitutia bacterium UBA7350]|nr:MAG: Exodeoxyribonuclease 7 large subunit [Opitutae bacterium UBA7350]
MPDLNFQPDAEQVLEVSALTRQIKRLLEGSFTQVWVRGEISNCRVQSSGHVYFSLKDSGSQIPCVLFARDAARQDFELHDGEAITVFGDLAVYTPHGRYQLIAKIALHAGEGRLQIEFERLKRALATEGLFDSEHKQPLPAFPKQIAVITSPTGAALRDFLGILKRRNFIGSVVVYPVRVQGKEAASEIENALLRANKHPHRYDTIVLTRGGGSIEDLWPFNNESLARTVANSSIPTISAVGHEIDQVLTDYTADIRAETPSAAAELVSTQSLEIRRLLFDVSQRLLRLSTEFPELIQKRLGEAQARLRLLSPQRQLAFHSLRIDDTQIRLKQALKGHIGQKQIILQSLANRLSKQHPTRRLDLGRQNLNSQQHRIKFASFNRLQSLSARILALDKRLDNTDIQNTLSRGFSIVEDRQGKILSTASATKEAKQVKARFHDGSVILYNNKKIPN